MDNNRTQFTFYVNYYETAGMCETAEGRLEWYEAIINFALKGIEPQFKSPDSKLLRAAWVNVYPLLNKAHQRSKAAKKREASRAAAPIATDGFFNS